MHQRSQKQQDGKQSRQHQQRDIDHQYKNIRYQIVNSNYFQHAPKSSRLIIQSWILKLDQAAPSSQFKRNRNNYAKVLNLMCDCDVIIEPFRHLPPMTELPKISKQQINRLIDEVQRLVRQQEQSQHSISNEQPPTLQECQIVINQNAKNSLFQRSIAADKMVNSRQLGGYRPKIQYFSVLEQSKESQNSIQRKEYFSEMKNRQNVCFAQPKNTNDSFTIQDSKQMHEPKHLVIKINTLNSNARRESKEISQSEWMDIDEYSSQNKSSIINDAHLANDEQNNTLKTQIIEQEYTLHMPTAEEVLDQCDLDNQLSQRCRGKDEVLNHSYFTWKKKEGNPPTQPSFYKSNLKLSESIPSKSLIRSKINSSSYNMNINQPQGDGSISIRSQLSLLSQLQYNSSHQSASSLKDISNSIIKTQF